MTALSLQNVQQTALSLYSTSQSLYWSFLPLAFLMAILTLFFTGDISGGSLEKLFRRLVLSVLLIAGFREISNAAFSLEQVLVNGFGGDESVRSIFAKVSEHAKELKEAGLFDWIKIGQLGLSVIATLSFLILSLVEHFLDVLHLTLWNLIHVLAPLAFLFCLFPSFSQIPKGIFLGIFELSLWRPIWVIMGKILVAIGYGEAPTDPSQWFDATIMNFSVAGLMAATPSLVHGFLNGSIVGMGGGTLQTMLGGTGAFLTSFPIRAVQGAFRTAGSAVSAAGSNAGAAALSLLRRPLTRNQNAQASNSAPQGSKQTPPTITPRQRPTPNNPTQPKGGHH